MAKNLSEGDRYRWDKARHPTCDKCGLIFSKDSRWLHHISSCSHKNKRTVIKYGTTPSPAPAAGFKATHHAPLPEDFFDAPKKRPPRAVLSEETKEALEVKKANKHDFLMKYERSCDKNLLDGARSKYLAYKSKARKAQPLVDYGDSDESHDDEEFYCKKMIGPAGVTTNKSFVEDSDDSDDSDDADDCYYKKKIFPASEAMKVKDLGKSSADAESNSYATNTLPVTVKAPIVQNKDIGGKDSSTRASAKCTSCRTVFHVSTQKHICRICEDIYCDKCANGSKENAQAVDICDGCMAVVGQSDVKESVS